MATVSIAEMADYYAGLLAFQYRGLPKATQFTRLLAKQALADLFALDVQAAYNISDAIGAQLDVIGRYVGVSRVVSLPINQPFFGFWDNTILAPVDQNTNGFADSTNPATNAQAIFYQSQFIAQSVTMLSDAAYRIAIQLKIITNTTDSSLAQIQEYLHTFLPGLVELVDNEDMSLTYTVTEQSLLPTSVLTAFLPKPAGVRLILVIYGATASPTSLSQTFHFNAPHTVTSSAITITPANGTAPYTYRWQRLTETRPDFPDFPGTTANSPSAASTTFTHAFGGTGQPKTSVSTWQCIVNDSAGLSTIVGPISVTLTIDGPP